MDPCPFSHQTRITSWIIAPATHYVLLLLAANMVGHVVECRLLSTLCSTCVSYGYGSIWHLLSSIVSYFALSMELDSISVQINPSDKKQLIRRDHERD